ncbi:MAG: hypothetical protein ACFFD4_04770 [Candidatus Odinarchaeota archaeon]
MADSNEERRGYKKTVTISNANPRDVFSKLKKFGNVFTKEITLDSGHYFGYLCGEVQYVLTEEVGISLLLSTTNGDGENTLDIAGFGGGSPTGRKDPEKKVVTQVISEIEYFANQEGWQVEISD